MSKTLIIGSCVCDMVVKLDHLPVAQEDINSKDVSMSLGGMAYNVYNTTQLLNTESIFGCPIGTGKFADVVEGLLKDKGYQPIYKMDDVDNGLCICLVDDTRDRTFICQHGAEYLFDEKWYEDIDLNEVSYVYISGLEVEDKCGNKLVSYLEKIKKPVLFAPGPRIKHIDSSLMDRLFKLNCILHLNDEEALSYTNSDNLMDACDRLVAKTKNDLVITLGSKGCMAYHDGMMNYIGSYPTTVVDTIGAGDCHAGAIIAGLNMGADIVDAARFANRVSSKVVAQVGSDLSKDKIEEIMEEIPW